MARQLDLWLEVDWRHAHGWNHTFDVCADTFGWTPVSQGTGVHGVGRGPQTVGRLFHPILTGRSQFGEDISAGHRPHCVP